MRARAAPSPRQSSTLTFFATTVGELALGGGAINQMRIALVSVAVLASFSLVACAGSDHVVVGHSGDPASGSSATVPSVTDAATFCTAMCSREQSCDKTVDTQTCENQCTNANAAVFPRLRGDVVDLVVSCFDGKDCKTVLDGEFLGACTADAVATVAPSTAAAAFCDALASAKKNCSGGDTTTKASCLNSAKLYSDLAIVQAQNCVKRSCTEIDTCVSAVFGSLGGASASSSSSSSSSGSCSGKFTDLGSCTTCAQTSCCTEASACYGDSQCASIVHACYTNGTSSSACSQAYSAASTSSQQKASTFFSCSSSKCSSSCQLGG